MILCSSSWNFRNFYLTGHHSFFTFKWWQATKGWITFTLECFHAKTSAFCLNSRINPFFPLLITSPLKTFFDQICGQTDWWPLAVPRPGTPTHPTPGGSPLIVAIFFSFRAHFSLICAKSWKHCHLITLSWCHLISVNVYLPLIHQVAHFLVVRRWYDLHVVGLGFTEDCIV